MYVYTKNIYIFLNSLSIYDASWHPRGIQGASQLILLRNPTVHPAVGPCWNRSHVIFRFVFYFYFSISYSADVFNVFICSTCLEPNLNNNPPSNMLQGGSTTFFFSGLPDLCPSHHFTACSETLGAQQQWSGTGSVSLWRFVSLSALGTTWLGWLQAIPQSWLLNPVSIGIERGLYFT